MNQKALKILFVDDESDLQLLMKQRFRKELKAGKYEFYFAENGIEALNVLAQEPNIWLVVSDINMPEMDGLTLLSEMSEKHPQTIAVIVSAYGDMSNIRQAMNLGAFDFVTKPIDFDDFNKTIDKTFKHIHHLLDSKDTSEKLEGIMTELGVAANIQQSILPRNFINNEYLCLHANMQPAKQIGGDFYDFFFLDPNQRYLALVMADVSGKGIPAALFMTVSRTLLRAKAPDYPTEPAKCMKEVNRILAADNENMMFVTVFYGILDCHSGSLLYTNAGHNPPFITNANGNQRMLSERHGVALGVTNGEYSQAQTQLLAHDCLFMYTDGVTEAEDKSQSFFSEERLANILADECNLAPKELILRIEEAIKLFSVDHIQSDDITMLVCNYSGNKPN